VRTICLHDRATIAAFLEHDAERRVYELGDLDDFFWPATTWYALADGDLIHELALAYNAGDLLVLLALEHSDGAAMRSLLRSLLHMLPRRFYAHLSPGLIGTLAEAYRADSHGPHEKMALRDSSRLAGIDTSAVERIAHAELDELRYFYERSYPGNWFDPRMVETGQYYVYREGGQILSAAGIHVYSPARGVAALGNITTLPSARGRGLATLVSARLCRELLATVGRIGLNVRSDNAAAIACYRRLGFERIGQYEEVMFESIG
jgi:ribosomal protein S18 acetylase RimI-like enzyme